MTIEQKAKAYNGFMDKECIALCDKLNSLSDIETTESCCGHCKQPYMIFFNCYNFIRLGKLFRCVNRNYLMENGELNVVVQIHILFMDFY